jgi:oxygen-dependent protoporphyrinogen oxidase
MIDALVSGIFAGDPSRLSLRACFPKMFQMESEHGGLVRAMLASRKSKRRGEGLSSLSPVATAPAAPTAPGADAPAASAQGASPAHSPAPGAPAGGGGMGMPTGTLTSFRGGIEELIAALAREMGSAVHPDVTIAGVARGGGGARWSLVRDDGATLDADAVILAAPAAASSRLLADLDPALAAVLGEIAYASVAVVCLGFDATSLAGPLDGFGFLVPRGEGVRILGALWDSSIYPGRAPAGKVLMRAMIGGSRDPDAVELSDAAMLEAVLGDLRRTMGLTATPEMVRIFRHRQGIPQYTLGHLDRMRRIDEGLARHPGVFVTGNSYRGIAINSCIAEAPPLAERVLAFAG